LLGQVIRWTLLPNPKRDHRDINWVKASACGLMPLPWSHIRFGPRHRRESCGFDRLQDVHAPVSAQHCRDGFIVSAWYMATAKLEFSKPADLLPAHEVVTDRYDGSVSTET